MKQFWPRWVGPDSPLQSLEPLYVRIQAAPLVALDIETEAPLGAEVDEDSVDPDKRVGTALDFRTNKVVGISLCWREDTPPPDAHLAPNSEGPWYPSVYIPIGHAHYSNVGESTMTFLRHLVESDKPIVTHGGTFDISTLHYRYGWNWGGSPPDKDPIDTALMARMWNENHPMRLKDLMESILDFPVIKYGQFDKIPFGLIPPVVGHSYACQDAYGTMRLFEWFIANLYPAALDILREEEFPIMGLFQDMSFAGIPINWTLFNAYMAACKEVHDKAQEKALSLLGKEINLGSHVQIRRAFASLGQPIPNTQAVTLAKVDHPAAKYITLAKQIASYKSRYLVNIKAWAWKDGKIRPRFVQWEIGGRNKAVRQGTRGGRSSAVQPPVHQLPAAPLVFPEELDLSEGCRRLMEKVWDPETESWSQAPGLNIRRLLTAPPGWVYVSVDQSQIEPRTQTAITGEPLLVETYAKGESIYRNIGAPLFGVPKEELTKKHPAYAAAKTYVLSGNYGAGAKKQQEELAEAGIKSQLPGREHEPITLEEVNAHRAKLQKVILPRTTAFREETRQLVTQYGYSETIFGWRRHAEDWHPDDYKQLLSLNNHRIQSAAFSVMKRAMVRASKRLRTENLVTRMVLQVHDEVVTLGPKEEVPQVVAILKEELTRPVPQFPIQVPLDTEVIVGDSFGTMIPYKEWLKVQESPEERPPWAGIDDPKGPSPEERKARFVGILTDALKCQACENFAVHGYQKVPPTGKVTKPVDLLWVGSQPYPEDVARRQLFSDKSGSLLRQTAYQVGLPIPPSSASALITPAVWCMAPTGSDVLSTHVDHCRVFLDQVIELAKPKVILALGSIAMRGVLRVREVGIEERLGWHTLPSGQLVMITYHPMNILTAPGLYSKFRGHMEQVRDKLKETNGAV